MLLIKFSKICSNLPLLFELPPPNDAPKGSEPKPSDLLNDDPNGSFDSNAEFELFVLLKGSKIKKINF